MPPAPASPCRFCASLEYDALPQVAIERVKHFFIDYIGIALHASTLDSSQPVRRLLAARPIPGGATLFGRPNPVSALGRLCQRNGGAQHGTG
jgi:2-methylcitrate dehydratase PrpD